MYKLCDNRIKQIWVFLYYHRLTEYLLDEFRIFHAILSWRWSLQLHFFYILKDNAMRIKEQYIFVNYVYVYFRPFINENLVFRLFVHPWVVLFHCVSS